MAQFEDLTVGKLTVLGGGKPSGSTLGTAVAGTISAAHELTGLVNRTTFTLTGASIPVTDAAASGSFGTLKLFTLPAGSVTYLGCRQNYTAFGEGAALTTAAGDAAFVIGVGTVALAAAADGALATTSIDIGAATATLTMVAGTGAGTKTSAAATAFDGTSTNATINLNWSGSAATIDANSTITVTGTITVLWALLGDD